MRRIFIFGVMALVLAVVLRSVDAVQQTFTATANATVQPAGPRTGSFGMSFFNIERSNNGSNSSYGVVDIPLTDAGTLFGGPISGINSVVLNLTRQDTSFTAPGQFSIYYTGNSTVSIDNSGTQGSASPLRYIRGGSNTNVGSATVGPVPPDANSLLPLSLLGSFFFPDTGSANIGTVDSIPLTFTGSALTDFVSLLNNGSTLRLVLTPDSTTTAATYAGATFATASQHQMLVIDANVAGLPFWDANGSAAGLGGTGTWDTTTANFNDNTGTGTPKVYDPSKLTVFAGTPGTVTIAAGGVAENRGLEFDVDGYQITGGALTVGSTDPITVTQAANTATINSKISGTNGLKKSGPGTLVLGNATNDFTGTVTVAGGTLQVATQSNLGPNTNGIELDNGGTLKFVPAGNQTLDSGRAVNGSGGALDVGTGNTATINGSVNMTGPLTLPSGGTVVLAGSSKTIGGAKFTSGGTIKAGAGGTDTVAVNGDVTVNGTSSINGNVDLGSAQRTISTNTGGTLVVTGGLTTNFSSNTVHLIVNGGGTLDVQGDNSAFINPMQIGTQNAAGPTIIVHDANSLGNVFLGTITEFFNSGTLNNQSGGKVTFGSNVLQSIGGTGSFPATYAGGAMEFPGAIGLFRPSGTATNHITVNGNTTFSGGWVPTGDAGTATNNSGLVVDGTGTLTLSNTSGGNFNAMLVPLVADGGVTVNFNGVNPHNDGEAVTIGSTNYTAKLQLGAKNGSRVNLLQPNAFAGSGATPAPASVALESGGILGTGGVDQSFGTLSVTSGGTLDLGATAGIVHFADSHAVAWSGTLNVTNWTGNIAGGGAEELLFGSGTTGLTAAQLAAIRFTGFTVGAKFVAGGEIVPASSTQILLGDVNGDGHVNNGDITAMMTALTDLNAYKTAHPSFDNSIGDVNADGSFNNKDIQGLITYLQTGHGSVSAVPESTSIALVGLAIPLLLLAGYRPQRTCCFADLPEWLTTAEVDPNPSLASGSLRLHWPSRGAPAAN